MATNIDVVFSIFKKELFIFVDGEKHDISNIVNENVWNARISDATEYWTARIELSKIVRNYIKTLDNEFDVDKIIL